MKKNVGNLKVMVSAIMTITMCISLLVGASYALFTSERKVNIAVTSGKVEVVATVENLKAYSDDVLSTTAYSGVDGEGYYFENGGYAMLLAADGSLKLDRIMPMDKATFDIRIKNNSNITVQYRTVIKAVNDNGLFGGLELGHGGTALIFNGDTAYTHWATLAAGVSSPDIVIPVSVLLPKQAGNEYQDKVCSLAYTVEAVQGNATVVDDASYIVRPTEINTTLTETAVVNTAVVMEDTTGSVKATIPANVVPTGTTVSLAVSTPQVKANSVTYEINLTDANGAPITLNGKASIELSIGKNLKNISMNHNGTAMAAEDYSYNATTGILTIKTASFSPFEVFFETDFAVQNGDKSYGSLADAVETAANGDTLMLIRDITGFATTDIVTFPADKTFTLDMNGKKIITAADFVGWPIANLGNLTVKGSGTIDSSASISGGYGAIRNDENGVLTIENGTFAGSIQGDESGIRNAATCVINGGDFSGTSAVYNEGKLTVNGGLFQSTSCFGCGKWAYAVNSKNGELIFNDGTVVGVQGALEIAGGNGVVNGGTFTTEACKADAQHASNYALYITGATSFATAEINGGTYTCARNSAIYISNSMLGDGGQVLGERVIINGGRYLNSIGTLPILSVGSDADKIAITGGEYCNNIVSNESTLDRYLGDGYMLVSDPQSGVTWYKVELVVASIGNVKYSSLSEAVNAAAADGDTIMMQRDVYAVGADALIKLTENKRITVDLNQKTMNYEGAWADTTEGMTKGKAIELMAGSLTVKNGTINMTGTTRHGISCSANTTLVMENIKVTGNPRNAIYCNDSVNLSMTNTTIGTENTSFGMENVTEKSHPYHGIYCNDNITIFMDNVQVTSFNMGIDSYGRNNNVTVKNCKITAKRSYALYQTGAERAINGTPITKGSTIIVENSTLVSEEATGIYVANGRESMELHTLTITECTIFGTTAVEMKHTNATITDSKLFATAASQKAENNNSGPCTTGYSLAITTNYKDTCVYGNVVVTNCTFYNGVTESGAANGHYFVFEVNIDFSVTINGTKVDKYNSYQQTTAP